MPLLVRELTTLYDSQGDATVLPPSGPLPVVSGGLARQDQPAAEAAWREALGGLEAADAAHPGGSQAAPDRCRSGSRWSWTRTARQRSPTGARRIRGNPERRAPGRPGAGTEPAHRPRRRRVRGRRGRARPQPPGVESMVGLLDQHGAGAGVPGPGAVTADHRRTGAERKVAGSPGTTTSGSLASSNWTAGRPLRHPLWSSRTTRGRARRTAGDRAADHP